MIQTIIFLLLGLALIVLGADWLVDGASGIARKLGISEFVIGLTIVGFGTSCPELVVSLTGALAGNADISIGNVLGSNIFNTLLILGVTALIMPVAITESNRKVDIPLGIAVVAIFIFFGYTGKTIARWEGITFLVLFAAYMFYCFKTGKAEEEDELQQPVNLFKGICLVLLGLAGLIVGGQWFVDSAEKIARAAGVSDKFIAITLLAGGTSLPELATCVVAASKKKGQLALGNILGSNIFNILLILGCSAVIAPLNFTSITVVDTTALILSAVALMLCACAGKKDLLDRWEGALMVAIWVAYFVWLFFNSGVTQTL